METQAILNEFYGAYDEDGRLTSRHGMVEFLTTMRYIEKYLQPGMRILEIGAATGRYSHTLARMGYQVDAVELIQHNIDIFKANTQPGENVTVLQGDARDLSSFANDTYDLTLILGPMYHLFTPRRPAQSPQRGHPRDQARRRSLCRILHGRCFHRPVRLRPWTDP